MKIIHTADIHLDSKLTRHLDKDRAKERRNELLRTFSKMVEYARNEGVDAILIAGDLFDVTNISATARNSVIAAIKESPAISFFYLRGNHDATGFIQDVIDKDGALPDNLDIFGDEWTSFSLQDGKGLEVVITGAELTKENNQHLVNSLVLDQSKFNIVTLHGQEAENVVNKDAEIISLRDFRNRGIDYLALGHIHEPKIAELDARGKYSYPGCLEGRGFDECGPRGFNMLDITVGENGNCVMEVEFIPFAERVMHEIPVDISDAMTSDDAIGMIRTDIDSASVLDKDMVKIVLVGEVSLDAEIDPTYIEKMLEGDFYYVTVRDKTRALINYDDFTYDKSLKGEFIRMIKAEEEAGNLTSDDAVQIIKTGVSLLAGEGVAV